MDVGGGLLKTGSSEWIVRSLGRINDLEQLKSVYIKHHNGQVVLLEDVAEVKIAPAERRGVASLNGLGEVVTFKKNLITQVYRSLLEYSLKKKISFAFIYLMVIVLGALIFM